MTDPQLKFYATGLVSLSSIDENGFLYLTVGLNPQTAKHLKKFKGGEIISIHELTDGENATPSP